MRLPTLARVMWPFLVPSIRFGDRSATLHGTGPPVVFSGACSGRLGWVPYATLVDRLARNVTVIVCDGPLRSADLPSLADALGASSVGLFAHADFDPALLTCRGVERAVLVDPLGLPDALLGWGVTVSPPECEASMPTLLQLTNVANPSVLVGMRVHGESVETRPYADVGSLDLFDIPFDRVASGTGATRGVPQATTGVPFATWRKVDPSRTGIAVRAGSRHAIVDDALAFLLSRPDPLPSTGAPGEGPL